MMPKILSTSNTKELKMFVLSGIAVFTGVKMMECFLSSKHTNTSLIDVVTHAQSKDSFKTSSQERFLRAHVQARGSHTL
jgi:hypothetical protein